MNNGKDNLKSELCKGFYKTFITSVSIYLAATAGVASTPAVGVFQDSVLKSGITKVSFQLRFGRVLPLGNNAFRRYLMSEWGIERFKEDFFDTEFSVLLPRFRGIYFHLTIGNVNESDTKQLSNQNKYTNFEEFNNGLGIGKEVLLSNRFVLLLRASYYESVATFEIYETNPNMLNPSAIYASSRSISISNRSHKIGVHFDVDYKFNLRNICTIYLGWYFSYRYLLNNSSNEVWHVKGTNQSITLPSYAKDGVLGTGLSIIFTSK